MQPVHRGGSAFLARLGGVIALGRRRGIALFGRSVSSFGALVAQISSFQQHLQERFSDLGIACSGEHFAVTPVGDPLASIGFAFTSVSRDFANISSVIAYICIRINQLSGTSALLRSARTLLGLSVAGFGSAVTCLGGIVAREGVAFPPVQGAPIEGAVHVGEQGGALVRDSIPLVGQLFPLPGEPFPLGGEPLPFIGHTGALLIQSASRGARITRG